MDRLLDKYLPEITEQQITDNVDVKVISAYGGMTCAIIKLSEVIQFVENQERVFGLDYVFRFK